MDIYPLYIVGNVQMSISYLLCVQLVHNFVLQLKIKVYIHNSIKKGYQICGQFFDD